MNDAFDETLVAAADNFFLLPGAEPITYFPVSGDSKKIWAVVTRIEAEQMPALDGGSRPQFEVLVKNDESEGIASDKVNTGGDKIELGLRVDNIPKMLRICEILNQDAGMILLLAW